MLFIYLQRKEIYIFIYISYTHVIHCSVSMYVSYYKVRLLEGENKDHIHFKLSIFCSQNLIRFFLSENVWKKSLDEGKKLLLLFVSIIFEIDIV